MKEKHLESALDARLFLQILIPYVVNEDQISSDHDQIMIRMSKTAIYCISVCLISVISVILYDFSVFFCVLIRT